MGNDLAGAHRLVRVRVLGPVQVQVNGVTAVPGRPKARVVLLLLALSANQPVSVGRLVRAAWPTGPPSSATANLRNYVSDLRRLLGDHGERLRYTPNGYLLRLGIDEADASRFEHLRDVAGRSAARGDLQSSVASLQAALALWTGEPADGLAVGGELQSKVAALVEARTATVAELAELLLREGDAQAAADALRRELARHPLRERTWELLIRAKYAAGDTAGALQAYRQARDVLVGELGIEPSEGLHRLHQAVLSRDPRLPVITRPVAIGPAPRAATSAPHGRRPWQVPAASAALTGRDDAVERIRAVLSTGAAGPVVVVVHGGPGTGKSALALHVAHGLRDDFPDGCLYADLSHTTEATPPSKVTVLARFLRALAASPEPIERAPDEVELAARFRTVTAGSQLLVVLDNAVDAAQIRPMLPTGQGCVVLVTSRRGVGSLDSSARVELSALPQRDAIAMLASLLGANRVEAEPRAASALARFCWGLPLALRIVCARLAGPARHSLTDMANRLADERTRLDQLCTDELSMRASVRQSLHALDPTSATLLRALAAADTGEPSTAMPANHGPAHELALERLVDEHLLEIRSAGHYRVPPVIRLVVLDPAHDANLRHSPR